MSKPTIHEPFMELQPELEHWYEMVEGSHALIAALDHKAQQFPQLEDEISTIIRLERANIRYYQQKIEQGL